MLNYTGKCKDICSCNLVYNVLIELLLLQSSVFLVDFSNPFWHANENFPKDSLQNETVPFLFNLLFFIQLIGVRKYVFTRVLVKTKLSHSCHTRVALVSFLQQQCAVMSHLCRSCLTCVSIMSLVSDTRVVKQTRSHLITELKLNSTQKQLIF